MEHRSFSAGGCQLPRKTREGTKKHEPGSVAKVEAASCRFWDGQESTTGFGELSRFELAGVSRAEAPGRQPLRLSFLVPFCCLPNYSVTGGLPSSFCAFSCFSWPFPSVGHSLLLASSRVFRRYRAALSLVPRRA
jgi:hypothetical protein